MVSITILYPSGPEFNLKYYMDTHMPLVAKSVDVPFNVWA